MSRPRLKYLKLFDEESAIHVRVSVKNSSKPRLLLGLRSSEYLDAYYFTKPFDSLPYHWYRCSPGQIILSVLLTVRLTADFRFPEAVGKMSRGERYDDLQAETSAL